MFAATVLSSGVEHSDRKGMTMRWLIRWLISAVSLLIVAYFVPDIYVRGFTGALIAAAVIGFVNATLGTFLRIVTFPVWILTLGLFLIVINAAMLKVAAFFLGSLFEVRTWWAAIIGAILLSLVSAILHWIVGDSAENTNGQHWFAHFEVAEGRSPQQLHSLAETCE